jgi:hypothetical protein
MVNWQASTGTLGSTWQWQCSGMLHAACASCQDSGYFIALVSVVTCLALRHILAVVLLTA